MKGRLPLTSYEQFSLTRSRLEAACDVCGHGCRWGERLTYVHVGFRLTIRVHPNCAPSAAVTLQGAV